MKEENHRWQDYYEKIKNRKHSPRTEFAATLNASGNMVAIDCGCGVGADIQYLSELGYQVHGFDSSKESVSICNERFTSKPAVSISHHSFETFEYPSCGLVIANLSLFFANPDRFSQTWKNISDCIKEGGVFSGDFMGPEDSWVSGSRHQINALTRQQVEALFEQFEIIRFEEHNEEGMTALGKSKNWHTFSVVAVKRVD